MILKSRIIDSYNYTYEPLESTAGVSAVGYWVGNIHFGFDLKESIVYSAQKPTNLKETYVLMPINKRFFIQSKYDFHSNESYMGLTYRF